MHLVEFLVKYSDSRYLYQVLSPKIANSATRNSSIELVFKVNMVCIEIGEYFLSNEVKGVYEKPIILITHSMTLCSEEGKKSEVAHLQQHKIIHRILSATNVGCRNKATPMQTEPI